MRFVTLSNCKPNMILARDVITPTGDILIRSGHALRETYIQNLINLGYAGVYIEDDLTKINIEPETISQTLRSDSVKTAHDIFSRIQSLDATQSNIMLDKISAILDNILEQILKNPSQVTNIYSLKSFDQHLYQHSVDVTILSILIGTELNLTTSEINTLGKAAFFHDIGKMVLNPDIINKTEQLSKEEFEEIKKHTLYGHQVLKDKLNMEPDIYESALYHHECYDGTGYPMGLVGSTIPLFSRIIAVANAYDAMTTSRPYRSALLPSDVYEYILSCSGAQFDPDVVKAFLNKVAPFAVGTTVMLSDGRKAVVLSNNPGAMLRPTVHIVRETASDPELTINLALDKGAEGISIFDTF